MKILILTSEWPSDEHPNNVPFLVDQVNYINGNGIITEIHKIKSKSLINKFKSIIELRKKLKKNRYDLIHTHWGYNGIYCLGSNTPQVITYHGSDLNKPKKYNFRLIILYIISRFAIDS